jgi:Toxin SymE, type I toxin-antitoxin system
METPDIKQPETKDRSSSYQTKQLTVHRKHLKSKPVPWISLSGVWLDDLGFAIGEKVNIIIREHLLIIELPVGQDKETQNYKTALREVKRQLKKLTK